TVRRISNFASREICALSGNERQRQIKPAQRLRWIISRLYHRDGGDFEIGQILHLKSEIRNFKLDRPIYDFGLRDLRCAKRKRDSAQPQERICPISDFFVSSSPH